MAVTTVPEGALGVGIQLPVIALSTRFAARWEHDASVEDLVRIARAADAAGLHYVGVCDHIAVPRNAAEQMSDTWYDPIATLGLLAGVTERVRLLTHVYVLPYRHPLAAAKAFATLDHLSGGRLVVGVGAGHVDGEFETLGIDFASRGARLDEAIDAVACALENEWPDFAGAIWSFKDVGIAPRPVQQPRPPIWVGGSSKPAMRRAARVGDGWLPQGSSRRQLRKQAEFIRAERERVRDDAIELGSFCEPIYVGTPGFEVPSYALTGSGDAIAASLREFGELGAAHVQTRFLARSVDEMCDQIAEFGAEVLPQI